MSRSQRRAVLCWVLAFHIYLGGLIAHDAGWVVWPYLMSVAAALHGAACFFIGYHRGYGEAVAQQWDELRDECDLEWARLNRADELAVDDADADDDERDRH